MDRLDLLALQGTLKTLLQHHSSKVSILLRLAFFIVQLSHPCMTIGKAIALTRWIFVSKVMCLLSNTLSRFVTDFLPNSKCHCILWQQSQSTSMVEPKKMKFDTFSPCVCHEVIELDAVILVFWMLIFKPGFSLFSFTLNKRFFSYSSLSAIWVVSSAYWACWSWFQIVIHPAQYFMWYIQHIS